MRQRQTINQPVDIELSGKSLKGFIALNEADAVTYGILKSYMDDNPEVQRDKPTELLTVNNFADYIATINTGYLLGRNVDYSVDDEAQEANLAKINDWYSEQHMGRLDSQLGLDLSTYGRAYEINYADEESKVRTAKLSVFNTFVIYDDSYKHKKQYAISYTPQYDAEGKEIKDAWNITAWSRTEEIKYSLKDEALTEESRNLHFFGRVPVIEYFNNSRLRGDFEPVISLIDAYNILQTDRVIDREKLVDAILAISGAQLSPEDQDGIKNNRTVGLPKDSKIEYVIKELNEANADVLRQVLATDIHKFSMTPDMTDKEFIGNSSGVALKYKLLPFENKAQDKEQYFEDGLRRRLELYIAYMSKRSMFTGTLSANDIDISFHRSLPQNDYETSQMITNLTGLVDRATLAGNLSFVHDADATVERAAEEESALVETSFGTTEESVL